MLAWIMNCVGYKNMKFFLLFLLYAWLGCLLHIILAIRVAVNPEPIIVNHPKLKTNSAKIFFGMLLERRKLFKFTVCDDPKWSRFCNARFL